MSGVTIGVIIWLIIQLPMAIGLGWWLKNHRHPEYPEPPLDAPRVWYRDGRWHATKE
jgi:hypothetical protein